MDFALADEAVHAEHALGGGALSSATPQPQKVAVASASGPGAAQHVSRASGIVRLERARGLRPSGGAGRSVAPELERARTGKLLSGKGSRATHPDDAASSDLIEEFLAQDEDFRALVAGELTVRFETLAPIENPDQRVLLYRAADDESRAALDRLFAS